MKKLFYLLLLLPLAMFSSCSKDELAPFDMSLTLGGVTQDNGSFYVVSGENVQIGGLTVKPVGGKETAVANVMFYIDGMPIFGNPWNVTDPISFSTLNLPTGPHTIGVTGNLLQVDQSIQNFSANYSLVIVPTADDLPAGAPETGTYTQTITFNN